VAAVAMFAYGVALSYSVLVQIAAAAGLPAWAHRLWPLGWELFMAAAALNALADQRHLRHQSGRWGRVPWYPWALVGLTAGGSILLNWFHPAIPLDPPPGWLTSLVYGLPPLEAVLAWHLFLGRLVHRTAHQPATVAGPADNPVQDDHAAAAVGTATPGPTAPADPIEDDAAGPPAGVLAEPGPSRRPAQPPPSLALRQDRPWDGDLLGRARRVATEFQTANGRPIGRDALRRALRVSNQTAGTLLRALRDQPPAENGDQDQDQVQDQVGERRLSTASAH
jgi:hypothetical protein